MIAQPNFIREENGTPMLLFTHQLKTVYDMVAMERRSLAHLLQQTDTGAIVSSCGFLRDAPGYGKTLSMCTLIALDVRNDERGSHIVDWDLSSKQLLTTYRSLSPSILQIMRNSAQRMDVTLIVCSSALFHQWMRELKRCGLEVCPGATTSDIEHMISPEHINMNFHVVLVTAPRLSLFMGFYGSFAYRRIVVDEIMDILLVGCTQYEFHTPFLWMISGTIDTNAPKRMEKKARCSLVKKFLPIESAGITAISVENDLAFLKQSVTLPPLVTKLHYYRVNTAAHSLQGLVNPHIQSLLDSGNIAEAARELGVNEDEDLITAVQRQLDKRINAVRQMTPGRARDIKMADVLAKISNIERRLKEALEGECVVCYSPSNIPVVTPCCYHVFCTECLLRSFRLRPTCPLCREVINVKKLIMERKCTAGDGSDGGDGVADPSSKGGGQEEEDDDIDVLTTQSQTAIKVLKKLISEGKKILFYSAYDNCLAFLGHLVVPLRGTEKQLSNTLHMFREGEVQVLYANSLRHASGINLPETTDVVLYHKMDAAMRDQIVGRALRVGCDHPVVVHELRCVEN